MSGLSDADRESLLAWWDSEWPRDVLDALDTLETAVEAIVRRRVTEALTEAADAATKRVTRNIGGHPYSDHDRGLSEASRIVRARIPN